MTREHYGERGGREDERVVRGVSGRMGISSYPNHINSETGEDRCLYIHACENTHMLMGTHMHTLTLVHTHTLTHLYASSSFAFPTRGELKAIDPHMFKR